MGVPGVRRGTAFRWIGPAVASLVLLAALLIVTEISTGQSALAQEIDVPDGDVDQLIAAITAANEASDPTTISLSRDGEYVLTHVNNTTIEANGLPVITGTVTINGNGATIRRASGSPEFRIFEISSGGHLQLNELTMSGGRVSIAGGILNAGNLTLTDSVLRHNSSESFAGGIWNNVSGSFELIDSTISENFTRSMGGGIYNTGQMTSTRSTVSKNSAIAGGGIFNSSVVALLNSTVSSNNATFMGGGVANEGGSLFVINSTLSDNAANSAGGGISNGRGLSLVSTLSVIHGTVSENTASTGGGIYNADASSMFLRNTLVTGNGPSEDIANSGTLEPRSSGNLIAGNAMLGPLQDNGGSTKTMALLSGSPAIDATPSCTESQDQRGISRPQGEACDIGAFEFAILAPVAEPQAAVTDQETQIAITLVGRDPQNKPLTFDFSQPENGSLTGDAPDVVYVPNSGFAGEDSFTFIVNNGDLDSDPATVTVTVRDVTPPVISDVPDDITAEATASDGAIITYEMPEAHDAVDGAVLVSCDPEPGSTFSLGEIVVECTASDAAGNKSTASFAVTVEDTTPPLISNVPDDITVETTNPDGLRVDYELPEAYDAVDGTVPVSCFPESGSTFSPGETQVECSVSDHAGNEADASFTVTVALLPDGPPSDPPTPPDDDDDGDDDIGNVPPPPPADDNDAADDDIDVVPPPPPADDDATDDDGDVDEGNRDDDDDDIEEPGGISFSGVPEDLSMAALSPAGAILDYDLPAAQDGEGNGLEVSCAPAPGTWIPIGQSTVTCTATDGAGEMATVAFGVRVLAVEAIDFSPRDEIDNPWFWATWARTDLPVRDLHVSRTWMWGPGPFTTSRWEPYTTELQNPGGAPVFLGEHDRAIPETEREVIYFDKARMEINDPEGDSAALWYVTNGLLVVEMITGNRQFGDDLFIAYEPSHANVAGDADDLNGPTYASLQKVLDAPAQSVGTLLTQAIDRYGNVTENPEWGDYGIEVGFVDEVTEHGIAGPFWAFMQSEGLIQTNGELVDEALFENPFYATGRPVTEAYWATVAVGGDSRDVLLQCFERRCLTWTPGNSEGFVVEAGNVGQHYYHWRYVQAPD